MKTNFIIASPIAKTLVYANLFIAVCASAQVIVTYKVFPVPVNYPNNWFILFVFLATYLQYNVQRGYFINTLNLHTESGAWLTKYRKPMFVSVLVSLVALFFLCNNLSYTSIAIMVGAELVSTFYYLPPLNLRKYGYVKPLVISLIWVISCNAVPLIENQLFTVNSLWFLGSQFCFISVISILFDVKDMTDDYLNGIDTYANRFGLSGTKIFCSVLLIAAAACFYMLKQSSGFLIPELLLLMLALLTVFYTTEKKHRFYYYLWIDGLLLLQAILFYWL